MANLRIKLVKSLSGRLDKHIATAKSLGLAKIGDSIQLEICRNGQHFIKEIILQGSK